MTIPRIILLRPDGKSFESDLNDWVNDIRNILYNGLTFREHVNCQLTTIQWMGNPVSVNVTRFKNPALGIYVMSASQAGVTGIQSGLPITYSYTSGGVISITDVGGLTGATYNVTLAIYGG